MLLTPVPHMAGRSLLLLQLPPPSLLANAPIEPLSSPTPGPTTLAIARPSQHASSPSVGTSAPPGCPTGPGAVAASRCPSGPGAPQSSRSPSGPGPAQGHKPPENRGAIMIYSAFLNPPVQIDACQLDLVWPFLPAGRTVAPGPLADRSVPPDSFVLACESAWECECQDGSLSSEFVSDLHHEEKKGPTNSWPELKCREKKDPINFLPELAPKFDCKGKHDSVHMVSQLVSDALSGAQIVPSTVPPETSWNASTSIFRLPPPPWGPDRHRFGRRKTCIS